MNKIPQFPAGLEALPDCAPRPEAGRRVRVDDGRRQGRHGALPLCTGKLLLFLHFYACPSLVPT